jgi:hypothetical protein
MKEKIRIAGIGGSMAVPSNSLAALKIALKGRKARARQRRSSTSGL